LAERLYRRCDVRGRMIGVSLTLHSFANNKHKMTPDL
jgi:hypothetical protein